jgi:NAD(P)-dependent dehydrogenase (short-subunit alcohol dehydrogenase family)
MIKKDAVWLITGCSKGLGRALAEEVLESGYRVVATARDTATLADLAKDHPQTVLALPLDVTQPDQAKAVVQAAEQRFGAVDVLVNNAGYGYVAAIEEGDEAGVRELFETNIFGTWNMIKAVLPGMRARGRGHIVNMSSMGGLVTFPAVGFYHMSKFAVEGLSETLAKELTPFGLGVTVVEPGSFRTDFRGSSMKQSPIRIPAYENTTGKARDALFAGHGKQPGDPALAVKAIISAVQADHPPLHLVLGSDALDLIRRKITDLQNEMNTWETLTRSTGFKQA